MSDTNVSGSAANEFDIPMDTPEQAPEPTPAQQMQSTLDLLAKLAGADAPAPAAETETPEKAEPEAAGDPVKSEIDTIMESLADEPQAIQDAVRAALEKGVKLESALAQLESERAAEQDSKLVEQAEQTLIADAVELSKKYPGFSEADLVTTLTAISKMPKALAEALTLEESAARALGREVLESRRSVPVTPGGDPPAVPRTSDPAVVIGDATPGPGAAEKPFDAGSGGDFMDIANYVTKTAGNSLVAGSQR